MKRLAIATMLLFSGYAHSYNAGHFCITYLSKTGEMVVSDEDKYTEKDLGVVIEKLTNDFHGEKPALSKFKGVYLDGMSENKGIYEAIEFMPQELIYQNGVFYIKRTQDFVTEFLWDISQVVGGSSGINCIETDEH